MPVALFDTGRTGPLAVGPIAAFLKFETAGSAKRLYELFPVIADQSVAFTIVLVRLGAAIESANE